MADQPAVPLDAPGTRIHLRGDAVAWRRVVDDVIVLDTDASLYHAVNDTGAGLWEQLAAGATLDELTAALLAEHPDAGAGAPADVRAFVDQLVEAGLVDVVAAGPPN